MIHYHKSLAKIIRLLALGCLVVCPIASGQSSSIQFQHFSRKDGLSQMGILAMARDAMGFLWVGTQDGLNRFDGYQFQTFRYHAGAQEGLPSNWIEALHTTKKGQLFIGTTRGLVLLDPSNNRFTKVALAADESAPQMNLSVTNITEDERGHLWVCTFNGLIELDQDLEPLRHLLYRPDGKQILGATSIESICFSNGVGWIGTRGAGLWRLEGEAAPVQVPLEELPAEIFDIVADRDGSIWLATQTGLIRYWPKEERLQAFLADDTATGLVNNRCTCLMIDKLGRIWIGTRLGLSRFDPKTEAFVSFLHAPANPNSLSYDFILSIFQDPLGLIWVGTEGGDLNQHDPDTEFFHAYHTLRRGSELVPVSNIRCFAEESPNRLWIGHQGELLIADLRTGTCESVPQAEGSVEIEGQVVMLAKDPGRKMWVATFNQVTYYDFDEKRFKHEPGLAVVGQSYLSSMRIRGDNLYLGTRGGLYIYNLTHKSLKHYSYSQDDPHSLVDNFVLTTFLDRQGRLWVGTLNSGISRMDRDGYFERLNQEQGLSHPTVTAFAEDHDGQIWAATQGGLNVFYPATHRFKVLGENEGLPNEALYAIQIDPKGFLWASSNKGLARIDPLSHAITAYQVSDGLQGEEYNNKASLKRADGTLLFGGTEGFNAFAAEDVPTQETQPEVVITDLLLFNRSVSVNSADQVSPLKQPIWSTKHLTLSHNEAVVSFKFSSLNYKNPAMLTYAYQMDGFDKDWLETDQNRYATYTNLPAGDYTFKLKARNRSGAWGPETSIEVRIEPAPWLSPMAFTGYASILVLIVLGFVWNSRRGRIVLERNVADRTAQLHRKNEILNNRNRELEGIDHIVRTINAQIEPADVMQVLTDQIYRLFKGADRVSCFLLDPQKDAYRIVASRGFADESHHQNLYARPQLEEHYLGPCQEVGEGLLTAHHFKDSIDQRGLRGIPIPQAMVALTIVLADRMVGCVLIDSINEAEAFRDADHQMLLRLRQHAISALTRARQVSDLVEAQRQLADAAHAAGMAESAVEVLHNLGNVLNSVKTSVQLIREKSHNEEAPTLLKRIAELLADQADLGAFLQKDPRGGRLAETLLKLAGRLQGQMTLLGSESEKLDGLLQEVTQTLLQQQEHTLPKEHSLEPVDLNSLLSQALQNEFYLLREKNIEIQEEQGLMPTVFADRNRMIRILSYLLENARDSVEEGVGRILIGTEVSLGFGQLYIQDNGIGIIEEHLELIYRNGFTTKEGRRGFGLHYCANALKEMDGELRIESKGPGQGTRVTISLPLAR